MTILSLRAGLMAAGAAVAIAMSAGTAQARDVNWSVGINSPGVSVGVGNGYPVYVAPQPIYYAPPPVYYSPPRPVYYAPPAYYAPGHYYRDGHRNRYDRDDRHHRHGGYRGRGHGHGRDYD